MITKSEQINELFTALSRAQGMLDAATKDALNPHFGKKYADLNSVWNACREALSKNSLCVVQTHEPAEKGILRTITTLGHSSGQWISSTLDIPLTKHDAQGVGSAMSYARRYALAAIVGITQDDDDGESTMIRTQPSKTTPAPKPKTDPMKPKQEMDSGKQAFMNYPVEKKQKLAAAFKEAKTDYLLAQFRALPENITELEHYIRAVLMYLEIKSRGEVIDETNLPKYVGVSQ